jgi:hypothetical protein
MPWVIRPRIELPNVSLFPVHGTQRADFRYHTLSGARVDPRLDQRDLLRRENMI